jgi:hypothetical protein
MEKIRNHKTYGAAIVEFLNRNPGATWGDTAQFLMDKFNWSKKTSANRLFELRKINLIRVEGTFTRLEIGKAMRDERRLFANEAPLDLQSELTNPPYQEANQVNQ